MIPQKPLNGTKTHPLTRHAYDALARLLSAPIPKPEINAGVIDRLLRESLVAWVDLPNPYPSTAKKHPLYPHLQITEAGRKALASRKS